MKNFIKVIAFDADDTLWDNLIYFKQTEDIYCDLMSPYYDKETAYLNFFEIEHKNIAIYGYGVKSFILSMIEAVTSYTPLEQSGAIVKQIV